MSSEKKAVDHSHHLSDLARRHALSPLKGLQKYYGKDLIPFAGGLPSPEYFPFTSVSAQVPLADAFPLDPPRSATSPVSSSPFGWLWRLFGASKGDTTHVQIPREPRQGDGGLNLSKALQYGPVTGLQPTQAFVREFTQRIYAPAYDDWTTLAHAGNTDGWSRVAKLLLNPGDTLLVEEWTYPSALASARPIGARWKAVPMDGQGMRPDALREILAGWDVERDGPRPRVIYTVPVGQNPTGVTLGLERKKAIYDLCVQYDIIIAEDDPYYFLQVGEFVPKSLRKAERESAAGEDIARFIASLVPTYLRVDTQGRVIRLDTFSKTIAPGVRLGWFTCSPLFAERLERIGEVSTMSPCGLSQALVVALLSRWTFDGYVRWLRGLRTQYKLRRDFFVDCLMEEFDVVPTPASAVPGAWVAAGDQMTIVFSAYRRGSMDKEKPRPLLSFVPPSAGMFVWMELYFGDVPNQTDEDGSVVTPERQFFTRLADAGVLTAPGWFFLPETHKTDSLPSSAADHHIGHTRLSYTPSDAETTRRGVKIFAKTLREFCRV
ncbi:PLP-dependent transferase [Russula earlei]|uniref:PLP-dependent transferase n=1 Tax=Russula earlei TaxID=71964 RepID=A0ACC0U6R6_9AGAM|nr:PLP-dependent transferase [Russula earlei]